MLKSSRSRSAPRGAEPWRRTPQQRSRLTFAFGVALAIATVAMLSVAVSGATAKTHQKVTIQVAQPTGFEFQWGIMASNFERVYPNINVDISHPASAGNLPALINTQLAAGNAPDLWMARPGPGQAASIIEYAKARKLADLSKTPWAKRVYPAVRDGVTQGGKVYGWPMELIIQGVFYDRDVFRQLGLTVPTRFRDLLSFCSKVAAMDKIPMTLTLATPTNGQVFGAMLADQNVYAADAKWSQKRATGQATFAGSPGWRRALQQIVAMKNADCFEGTAPVATSESQAVSLFATGRAVALVAVASRLASVKRVNSDLNLGYFIVPPVYAKRMVVPVTLNNVLVVNAASRNLGAAKAFVNFVAREKQSRTYAKAAGSIAPFDAARAIIPDHVPFGVKATLGPLFKAGRVVSQPSADFSNPAVAEALGAGVQGLLTGQKSVGDVLKDMDDAW